MSRPSIAQLQEQVQLLKEAEGIVDQPEKIVLQDAAAIKHKLDQTASQVSRAQGSLPDIRLQCCVEQLAHLQRVQQASEDIGMHTYSAVVLAAPQGMLHT